MTDYRKLCVELFGTDNEEELRAISGRLRGGRKKALGEEEIALAFERLRAGSTVAEVAKEMNVSRQTLSKYLNRAPGDNYALRIDFMYKQKVCTEIYVDFELENVSIVNRTDDINKRAFGVVEKPTWENFGTFMEDRCLPRTRYDISNLLKTIGVDSYDPIAIAERTAGRISDDDQYLRFSYRKRMAL